MSRKSNDFEFDVPFRSWLMMVATDPFQKLSVFSQFMGLMIGSFHPHAFAGFLPQV